MTIALKKGVTVCLLCLVVGIALGAWGEYTWGPRLTDRTTVERTIEKPIVTEKVVTLTDTQIAYVPKEVVRYVDAQTGKEVAQPIDGKFDIGKPEFVYTINGKLGKFIKTDDEQYVFDKNMLQLTQTSTIKIDAEIPDQTKRKSAGIWYTNHGAAVSIGHAPKPYVELKGIVGVPDPKKLYGAGVEIRF